ncbi:MAG: glycosyltransferase family 1 protein, partial [Chloroflexi bacterium]
FELAAMRACMVCNPYEGIETWFEPEKELIVVHSTDEAIERYTWLLEHESARHAIAQAAHERFLKEHTYRHRARQFVEMVRPYL